MVFLLCVIQRPIRCLALLGQIKTKDSFRYDQGVRSVSGRQKQKPRQFKTKQNKHSHFLYGHCATHHE